MSLISIVSKVANPFGPHFDKVLHFAAGTACAILMLIVAVGLNASYTTKTLLVWMPVVACALLGAGKEAFDALRNWRATGAWRGSPVNQPHGVEILDAAATALPGLLVTIGMVIASR
jgi:hypothetical protein